MPLNLGSLLNNCIIALSFRSVLKFKSTLYHLLNDIAALIKGLQSPGVQCCVMFQGAKEPALHLLDCLFSVLVVGSLVVIVWRGTWGILDHVLLPQDEVASAWVSLVSLNTLVNTLMQTIMTSTSCRVSGTE